MVQVLQEQQKNMMEIVGQQVQSLNTARINFRGAGTQTAGLAILVVLFRISTCIYKQQQKNGQVQVLHKQLQSQLLNPLLIYLINVERVKK
jgi:hypothetical protein